MKPIARLDPARRPDWDIFCTVVDNFGDIGVCWRLARQLQREEGHTVRLWVDDLASFAALCPAVDRSLAQQTVQGVEVRYWPADWSTLEDVTPARRVVEAFACNLPDAFVQAMADGDAAPAWINLEYLSAERWVGDCHGMPSPHPSLPLRKYFFFPGFRDNTGGVLGEADLSARRDALQHDPARRQAAWATLGLTPPPDGMLCVSLFCYGGERVGDWLTALADQGQPVRVVVPEGLGAAEAAHWCGQWPSPGWQGQRGCVSVVSVPFMAQEQYDSLLWLCDINLVRGEDSFVRAQWAALPFVWHIYPQDDSAHLDKLRAFLTLYQAELPAEAAAALTDFWLAWNHGVGIEPAWRALMAQRLALAHHARGWAAQLARRGGLAANLARFCESLL